MCTYMLDGGLVSRGDGVGSDTAVRRRQVYGEAGGRDHPLAAVVGAASHVAVHDGGVDGARGPGTLRTIRVRRLPHRPTVRVLLGEVLAVVRVREPRGGRPARRGRHVARRPLGDRGRVLGGVLRVGDGRGRAAALRLRVTHRREDVVVVHLGLETVRGDDLDGRVAGDQRGRRGRCSVDGAAAVLRRVDELVLDGRVVVVDDVHDQVGVSSRGRHQDYLVSPLVRVLAVVTEVLRLALDVRRLVVVQEESLEVSQWRR